MSPILSIHPAASQPLTSGSNIGEPQWMVDPGITLQKIFIDLGSLKPSYLGPPESYNKPLSLQQARIGQAQISQIKTSRR